VRLRLNRVPSNISRLVHPGQGGKVGPVRLNVAQCDACGFVQLTKNLDAGFYDDYLMTVSHSSQMRRFQSLQAARFVRRFNLKRKRIIEVGCGDGQYLAVLANAGVAVSGIEPSISFRRLAIQRGYQVYPGYVTQTQRLPGAPYDGFVARQVLEHVWAPREFLMGIRKCLAGQGVGLVEVPSIEQSIKTNRFYDFFPDHVNYFDSGTLRLALTLAGFEVLSIKRVMNGDYLEAHIQNGRPSSVETLGAGVGRLVGEFKRLCSRNQAHRKTLVVWGAGAKGVTFLSLTGKSGIKFVVDSDPHKQGLLLPVSGLQVFAPERILVERVDCVVITAMSYLTEIHRQLRQGLKFKGPIYYLGASLRRLQ